MNKLQYKKYNQLERKLDGIFKSYFIHKNCLVYNYEWKHKLWKDKASSYLTDKNLKTRINTVIKCRKKIVDIVKEICELADIEYETEYVLETIKDYECKSEFDRYRRYGL